MEVYVLNTKRDIIGIIDNYNSFIWTERYNEAGDFELNLPASEKFTELLKPDYYLKIKDSNTLMIIESIDIKTENKVLRMTVTGRSLISILDRRIILGTRYINYVENPEDYPDIGNNIWQIAQILMTENVYNPASATMSNDADIGIKSYYDIMKIGNNRRIPEVAEGYKVDPYGKIENKKPKNLQFGGNTVLESIKSICDKYHLGFKIDYDDTKSAPFIFSIYDGYDRTSDQNEYPQVILSPILENIGNVAYSESYNGYKNVIAITGEYGYNDEYQYIWAVRNVKGQDINAGNVQNAPKGLALRELVVDASDSVHLELTDDSGEQIPTTDNDYRNRLRSRADELLADNNNALKGFDGEVIHNGQYKIKRDYDLGDIIEATDGVGHKTKMRVSEVVYAHDASGYKIYPTLAAFEKDEYEE